jgi:hypothetical protein
MNRPLLLATVAFASTVCLSPVASEAQERLIRGHTTATPSAMPPGATMSGATSTRSGGSRRVAEPASATTSRTSSIADVGQVTLTLPGMAPAPAVMASAPMSQGHTAVGRAGAASAADVANRQTTRLHSIAAVDNAVIAQPGIAPAANAYGGAQGRLTMGSTAVGRTSGAASANVPNRATSRQHSIGAVEGAVIAQPGMAPASHAVSGAQGQLTMSSKAVGRANAKAQTKSRATSRASSILSGAGAETTLPGMSGR